MKRCSAGSIIRSSPDTAYQVGTECHATGPPGMAKIAKLAGSCPAAGPEAADGLRSCAKSCPKKAGSIVDRDANGAPAHTRCARAAGGAYPPPSGSRAAPSEGTNAAVYTTPTTSPRPAAAWDTTAPP